MRKIQIASLLLAAVLVVSSFAGCGAAKTQTVDTSSQKQDRQARGNGGGTMAKVVSLDGDQLTVILADMPDGNGADGQAPPDGTKPSDGNTPSDGAAPPGGGSGPAPASDSAINGSDASAGQPGQGEQPSQGGQSGQGEQPSPGGQPGQGGGKILFTGEQATYTLSTDVKITKMTGDSATEIDLSELAADDVITFTTVAGDDGTEVIDSIRVLDRVN